MVRVMNMSKPNGNFKNMTESDYLILNWNQSELRELSKTTKATVLPFATEQELSKGAYSLDGSIFYDQEKNHG